jgi:uncharacterized protein YndB with AHSA1/START domain
MSHTDTSYELTRFFQASIEKLFKAFINESVLKKIWGVSEITIDARPGGKANAKLEINGQDWNFVITYREVQPYERLKWAVHFEKFPSKETRVTLLFKKTGSGTEFTLRQENFETPQERDENRKAWVNALNILEGLMKE